MKSKTLFIMFASVLTTLLFAGCGSASSENGTSPALENNTDENTYSEASSASVSGNDVKSISGDTVSDDFSSTLSYISSNAGREISIDYSRPVDIDNLMGNYKPSDEYKDIESSLLSADKLTKTRITRKDNGGTMDAEVYRNRDTGVIDKIVTTEYGSSGRQVSVWYFKNRNIIYEYQYTDDLYGTGQHRKMISADDEAQAALMDCGYITYDALKHVPGYAKIYGYVGDEYGGILKNVSVTIKSAANDFKKQIETNGDGYYEFYVPVNETDFYNISYSYGDWVPDSLNDINITPGTTEYSCGEMYMASKGQNKHETEIYLMNINKTAPSKLKEGEYSVVLTYDVAKAELKPYSLNITSGKTSSNDTLTIKAGSDDDFKYYVTDSRNGSVNNMAYDMSKCDATVTVYDKDGIAASFLAPAAHAGVVWEVFEIQSGKIIPVNNCYSDTSSGIFFK